jgi:ribosomal protein L11 methyltransferase
VLELTLRVAAADVEDVLDAVLPALPGGTHMRHEGEAIELTIAAAPGTPDKEELRRLAGSRLIDLSAAEASDDWRQRRFSRYAPLVVADRFLIRPAWAPPGDDPSLAEIVLGQSAAFGTGVHPTTQACLAMLAEAEAGGSFADYGCGSGVLSIAAGLLGFSPVIAVDIDATSVAAARENAARNGVEIDARRVDVTSETPPGAETVVANVPPAVQQALTANLDRAPELAIASGFKPEDSMEVASAWGAHGLRVVEERPAMEWSVLVLR